MLKWKNRALRVSDVGYFRWSGGFLLEGCADSICAGGGIAGTDIDFFGCAGACAVMINTVGYITGNTVVFFTGFAGFFRRIVVHGS